MPEKKDYAVFAVLTIIILWNMLVPDYIFALDLIPQNHYKAITDSSTSPFYLALFLLNFIIPSWLIQKALLFLVIFLSFVTMYALIPTKSAPAKYFGALLYAINPFVFVRFLAGHINLLLAYSITPLAALLIMRFRNTPDKSNTIYTALIITLTGILNLHNLFLTMLLFFAIVITKPRKALIIPCLKVVAIVLLLNSYWLIQPQSTSRIDIISEDDAYAFRSRPEMDFNTAFTLASMHGFWRGGYDYAKDHIPFWPILFIIILFLTVHGYVSSKDEYRLSFAIIGIISIIIAAGVTIQYTKDIYLFLYDNIFFFKGFREPQKFIGLLVLAYAYLGSLGIERLGKKAYILLALPVIYSYTMFFGFSGALASQDYPEDYYDINTYLSNDKDDFNTLVLPWHMYMDYSWNKNKDKRLANVAPSFFTKPVISGDNMEVGGIYSSSTNPRSKYIENILNPNTTSLGSKLAIINVKYVLLNKEADYKTYSFLETDLALIKNTTNLMLFKNSNPVYKIYQTDDFVDIGPLGYEALPGANRIQKPAMKYVVLAEPYSDSWTLPGSTKLQNQPVNVWEYGNGTEIKRDPGMLYAGYAISLATLLWLLFALKTTR